jgi:hypothetical protein
MEELFGSIVDLNYTVLVTFSTSAKMLFGP